METVPGSSSPLTPLVGPGPNLQPLLAARELQLLAGVITSRPPEPSPRGIGGRIGLAISLGRLLLQHDLLAEGDDRLPIFLAAHHLLDDGG